MSAAALRCRRCQYEDMGLWSTSRHDPCCTREPVPSAELVEYVRARLAAQRPTPAPTEETP